MKENDKKEMEIIPEQSNTQNTPFWCFGLKSYVKTYVFLLKKEYIQYHDENGNLNIKETQLYVNTGPMKSKRKT